MDVKQKIIENVRQQGIISGQLSQLQEEANRLSREEQRLVGQMELLHELFSDSYGIDINAFISEDEEFKKQLQEASQSGSMIARGAAQTPKKPKPSLVSRSSNKTVESPLEKKLEEEKQLEVVRTRNLPKIIVTDDPPTPPDEDDDE